MLAEARYVERQRSARTRLDRIVLCDKRAEVEEKFQLLVVYMLQQVLLNWLRQ